MKTNKTKVIPYLVLLAILLFMTVTVFSLTAPSAPAYAEEGIKVKVYPMDENLTIGDIQKPDANNYIKLVFEISRPLAVGETVKVYYHTEDGSAVASANDYEKVSYGSYVSFTYADDVTANVLVKVNPSIFALQFLDKEEEIMTRRFNICFDKVEGGTFEDNLPEKITCQTAYTYVYDVRTISDVNVLNDYLSILSTVEIKETPDVDNETKYESDFDLIDGQKEQEIQLRYRDTKLASVYASATFEDIGEAFWNLQDVTFWLNTEEKHTVLMKVNADGAFMATTSTMGMAEIYVMCVNRKNPYVYENYVEQILGYSPSSIDADLSQCSFSPDYVVTRPYGENINYVFFKIPDNEKMNVYVAFANDSSARDRYLEGVKVYSQLIDGKSPEIVDYYVDSSSFKKDDKLRVICRFDEPVQISDTSKIGLTALFGSANTEVEFKYKEGNLTDTVCFEADMSEWGLKNSYTSMKLERFKGANLVTDFAYIGTSAESGKQNALCGGTTYYITKTLRGFSIDYRSPSIDETSIKCTNAVSSQIANRRDFILTVQGFSAGTIYYTFSTENTIDYQDNTSYAYCSEITSNVSTSDEYKFNFSASGLHGEYYVHVKIVSAKTGAETHYTYGVFSGGSLIRGYYFDTEKPLILNKTLRRQGLDYYEVEVALDVGTDVFDSPIETIFVSVAEDVYGQNAKSYCLFANEGSGYKVAPLSVKTQQADDTFVLTLCSGDAMFGLGTEKTSGEYYLSFYAVDEAGNMSDLCDYQSYRFDRSASFESSSLVSGVHINKGDIELYDLSQSTCTMTLSREDASYGTFSVYSVTRGEDIVYRYSQGDGDNDWKNAIGEFFDVVGVSSSDIELKVKKSGYYEIITSIITGETVQTSSNIHSVYCTNNFQDETENYLATKSGLVLKKRVFMLNSKYAYLTEALGVKEENYNNSAYQATFSSESVAKEYVRYMEYQDLYLVQLDTQKADLLNLYGSTVYVKADNETTYAKAGQYWIRYKRDTWMTSSSYSEWAYYFYKDVASAGIDIGYINNNLSNLKNAIDTVTDYIVGLGSYVDLVGENYVDEETKVAYLHDGQSHVDLESISATKLGQNFYPVISFIGDDALCSDTVMVEGESLPLASNLRLKVNRYTGLYLKLRSEGDDKYVLLKAKDGQTLKSAIEGTTGKKQTAIFTLLEIGGYGVRKYDVYVDNQAPSLKINYSKNDSNAEIVFTSELTEFNCTSCTIKSFVDEVDEMAYVAVYKSKTRIDTVYYASDLVGGVNLSTGVYYLEIGDRSGNQYTVTLKLNTSDLVWDASEVENGIRVSCSREEEEILRYEVKCNGQIINNIYAKNKIYTASGTYYVYIRDIYGNVASKTIEYSRAIPEIPFSYSDEIDGTYLTVTSDCPYVKITKANNTNTYYVVSSKYLAFRVDNDLTFAIKGLTENADYFVSKGLNFGKTSVKIGTKRSWTLVVGYVDYPDVTATYICSTENDAPRFEGTYKASEFSINDINEGVTLKDGTYIPSSIGITVGDKEERSFVSGASILSSYVKVKVSDTSGLASVEVRLDGKIIEESKLEKTEQTDGTTYIFRAKGSYTLVACDLYGNKSSFSFSNGSVGYASYAVDNVTVEKNVGTTYGNDHTMLTMSVGGDVLLRITDKNGTVYFYYYNIKFGTVGGEKSAVVSEYKYVQTKVYKKIADGDEIKVSDTDYYSIIEVVSADKSTDFSVENEHFTLHIDYDKAKNVTFTVIALEEKLVVESRATDNSDDEPYCNYTVLSDEISDIDLLCEGNLVAKENNATVRIKDRFFVDAISLKAPVSKVEIAYSATKVTGTIGYITYYEKDVIEPFDMTKEGFYYFKVTNVYGNVKKYTLNMSSTFTMNTVALFDDGKTLYYKDGYDEDIYANGSVTIQAYSESIAYTVNGNPVSGVIDGDEYTLTIRDAGEYEVKVVNEFGIEKTRKIHINKTAIAFADDILVGFNEGADKQNGYTMQMLSVAKQTLSAKGMKYVSYYFGGQEVVLYDDISEEKLSLEKASLGNRIGEKGNGEYKVIIKDAYGNSASKLISYQSSPLIKITRTTRQETAKEILVGEALANGVWSNNKVNISTSAKHGTLKVNGNVADFPKELALNSVSGEAKFDYEVEYSDEYGFGCKFEVHLLRQTITVSPAESVRLIAVGEKTMTRDNIRMTYSGDAVCYYQLNGGEVKIYEKDSEIKEDGMYYFFAEDKAGNIGTYTVTRDTLCDFTLTETESGRQLINGGIATSSVVFAEENSDTVYIDTAILNGKEVSSFEGKTFSKNGKWEILVKDGVGNVQYYTFYILLYAVNKFAYQAPYNYIVSALWFDGAVKGNETARISKMDLVDNNATSFVATEDGTYSVVIESLSTGEVQNFSFTIDNTPPSAKLDGCEENTLTTNTIKLSGLSAGDVVQIYRDGQLYLQGTIGEDLESPEITKGGTYKVIVTNKAGVSKEFSFEKKTIVNTAGSIFIIVVLAGIIIGLFIGLLLRKRTRVDK